MLQQTTTELLERWGMIVLAATSQDDAQRLLRDTAATPALIIADYSLRGEFGTKVVHVLRQEFGASIPALIVTADIEPHIIEEIRKEAIPLLIKPVSPPRLRVMMHNLLFEGLGIRHPCDPQVVSKPAMDPGDIPIGSVVPLTGPSAVDGAEFRKGIILACEDINAAGGLLGRKLQPVFVDTGRQSPEEFVGAANRLIEQHRVHAIVNGYNIGPQNSEYEPIADAGMIYINHNTLLQHHDTVLSNPWPLRRLLHG